MLACAPGALIWLIILLLPWRPWSVRERLEGSGDSSPPDTHDLTVLIPARNEAPQIGRTLAAIRERMAYSDPPKGLRGLGIAFIVTGLMALAFMAFSGISL